MEFNLVCETFTIGEYSIKGNYEDGLMIFLLSA